MLTDAVPIPPPALVVSVTSVVGPSPQLNDTFVIVPSGSFPIAVKFYSVGCSAAGLFI